MAANTLPPDVLEPIKIVFFEECEELLAELESGLLSLSRGERNAEIVNTVFRAVHSIKGGAASFGFDDLVGFAHGFETLLAALRAGQLEIEPKVLACLLRGTDVLADLVRAARDGTGAYPTQAKDVEAAFASYWTATVEEPNPTAEHFGEIAPAEFSSDQGPTGPYVNWTIRFRAHPALYAKANDPLLLLRELKRLGTIDVKLEAGALPALRDLDPEQAYLAWVISLATAEPEAAIREVFEFVEGDCDLEIALTPNVPAMAPKPPLHLPAASEVPPDLLEPAIGQSIRVDLDRVDRLVNFVGELVVSHAMLAQRFSKVIATDAFAADSPFDDLIQLTRNIQDSVLAIRSQPVKSVFQRMSRLVREVESATGKRVNLVTQGEGTEVDRTVIERLTDPLTHMIRNAIDHGIESPDERIRAGKPDRGTVRISASHRSGRIVIEVSDDGRGIDRKRVRAVATERGIISEQADLSDQDIDQLIFAPGFSTASAVSELSGRGVGMDVVKRGVQSLGGRITVSSDFGKGSVFSLSLPLTLALLDGMLISVAGETLIVPLTALVETLRPRVEDVHRLGPTAFTLRFRGQYIPMIDLGSALGHRQHPRAQEGVCLVVEDDTGSRAALVVDDIQGQHQVVIKSIQANYRAVQDIAAATILGDGRVALIVDINTIVASQRQRPPAPEQRLAAG